MSIRATLACDGEQAHERCRQAVPVGEVLTGSQARFQAKKHFEWGTEVIAGEVKDFCPACIRRRQETAVPRPRRALV